ncbi:MAG: hypothetical protein LBG62_00485 [Candidatus Methanoplasma sp.]|jgi:hypothetical protein|nr:hypothetical protein [Candidatus Methanoplasma sp.]
MREKMREMDLRLTELSEYLRISRATLYKYIDMYESGKTRGMDAGAKALFDYIENTPDIGKRNVMAYIVNNIAGGRGEGGAVGALARYAQSADRSMEKMEFIERVIGCGELDAAIPYLSACMETLSRGGLSDEEIAQVSKLVLFREDVSRNCAVTPSKAKEAKRILEERGDGYVKKAGKQ